MAWNTVHGCRKTGRSSNKNEYKMCQNDLIPFQHIYEESKNIYKLLFTLNGAAIVSLVTLIVSYDKNDVLNAIKDKDAVYHFAGIAGIDDCKKNPYNAINVNINGTVNVLEACINNSVPRIMFASSAYVFSKYGYI